MLELGGITDPALSLLRQYGYLALFVFSFLETSLLFPLLPSEVVVPAAAALLVTDPLSLLAFAAVGGAGVVAGSLVAYRLFGVGGRAAVERVGVVGVSRDDVDRGRRWFRRWGESSVLWGRLLPGLRSIVSVPAGFARMPVPKFAAYSATGGVLFEAGVAAAVLYGKRRGLSAAASARAERAFDLAAANPLGALIAVVAAAALAVAAYAFVRE